jgi:hypothetical protein
MQTTFRGLGADRCYRTISLSFEKDILLHQSGHIMLSDFDLSKSGSEPGGAPAGMKQSAQNGVSTRCWLFLPATEAN